MVKRRRWKSKLQVRGVIMKKVVKFGGSSLANAEQFQKVGDIIRSDESRRYVVPSAPGKRFDEDIKVTDMLYGCYDAASKGEDITEKINAIKARYYEIIKGLGLSLSLEEEFKKIDEDFRAQAGIQYAASRGEFLNGKIMAAYLGYDFVDAASVIRFEIHSASKRVLQQLHFYPPALIFMFINFRCRNGHAYPRKALVTRTKTAFAINIMH